MSQLTPDKILEYSEPAEQIYSDVVDALLLNIAKHFKSGKTLTTQQWEIKKLSELGAVNEESAKIIAQMTGQAPSVVLEALEQTAIAATEDTEKALQKGVKEKKITPPPDEKLLTDKLAKAGGAVLSSIAVREIIDQNQSQISDKLKLVNLNLLNSVQTQYRKIVANTVNIENRLLQTISDNTQGVLSGAVSRAQALRQTITQINKEGLAGFTDKAGRKWSAEAYVNMVMRTTVHNEAIDTVRARQMDYGINVFYVSRHSGARPLCYPYQGRYFSWDNKSGTITDGAGKRHRYSPVSSTSYGKAAGLFGVNCNHDAVTVIPGISMPHDEVAQDKKQNDKIYAESQKQRYLEREVRAAKREAAMLEAAGDKEGFEKATLQVRRKQANYSVFCKETGRTKRLDRTQVFEYNKSVSGKASAATKSIVSSDGISVKKTSHSITQAVKRNITNNQIADALKNPLNVTDVKYDNQGRPSKKYIGEKATVAVNPENGNIVTVHGTHTKLLNKLKGGENEV